MKVQPVLRRRIVLGSLLLALLLIAGAVALFVQNRNTDPIAVWTRPPVYPSFKLNVWSAEDANDRYLNFEPIHVPGRDPGEVTTKILYSETDDSPQSVLAFYSDAFRRAGWEPRSTTPDADTVRFVKVVYGTPQPQGPGSPQMYTFEVAAHDYSPYGTSVHFKLGVIRAP